MYPNVPVQAQPGMAVAPNQIELATTGQPLIGATGTNWMTKPGPVAGCPPGLEYLTQIDQLLVQQQVEVLESVTGYEQANRYRVYNSMGQQCYFALEESSLCQRLCCGVNREFVMHIIDNMNQEVLRVHRPYNCCACGGCCCSACCHFGIKVETAAGEPLGFARSACSVCGPNFIIMDNDHETQLEISGPCCIAQSCPCDRDFDVYSAGSGDKVGKITKQFSGFAKEAFTDADNFGVTFPQNLDVKLKATMLGVLFLIDFMFFESSGNNRKKSH